MNLQHIPVAAIDLPTERHRETTDQAMIDQLAISIKTVGLLHPISVVPQPAIPGRFTLSAGKHRFLAFRNHDIAPEIPSFVLEPDEVKAEMVEIAENIHRVELTLSERDRQMHRYAALFRMLHPEIDSIIRTNRELNLVQNRERALEREPLPDLPTPAEAVAENFRVSRSTAERAIRRAGAFTPDEREVLDNLELPLQQIDALAALKDPASRTQVITLLATNVPYADAMREVLGAEEAEDAEQEPPPPGGEDGLTDAEWLAQCPIRDRVNRLVFDADALRWRKVQAARIAFQRSIGWSGLSNHVGIKQGVYLKRLARFLDTPHPRDWVLCPACNRGGLPGGGACSKCQGGGYQLG